MKLKAYITSLFIISILVASQIRPLAMKPFDDLEDSYVYNRGSYLILLPSGFNETFLTNEDYGGDFVKFKKSQGFDVYVETISSGMTAQQIKDDMTVSVSDVGWRAVFYWMHDD